MNYQVEYNIVNKDGLIIYSDARVACFGKYKTIYETMTTNKGSKIIVYMLEDSHNGNSFYPNKIETILDYIKYLKEIFIYFEYEGIFSYKEVFGENGQTFLNINYDSNCPDLRHGFSINLDNIHTETHLLLALSLLRLVNESPFKEDVFSTFLRLQDLNKKGLTDLNAIELMYFAHLLNPKRINTTHSIFHKVSHLIPTEEELIEGYKHKGKADEMLFSKRQSNNIKLNIDSPFTTSDQDIIEFINKIKEINEESLCSRQQ